VRAAQAETFTEADAAVVAEQLGRPARGVHGVGYRCSCGRPLVVVTEPRLPNGTPFPTTYYLTAPRINSRIGTLEASGVMRAMQDRLGTDAELAAAYRVAHEAYLEDRAFVGRAHDLEVPEIDGISAGGMPDRVKCLHVLAAHALAAGRGLNPLGDETLDRLGWTEERCWCTGSWPGTPDTSIDTSTDA
jgi:hypothetical protein